MSRLPHQVTGTVGRVRNRVAGAVRQRVLTVRERSAREAGTVDGATAGHPSAGTALLARGPVAEVAFGGGYLVRSPGVPESPYVATWPSRQIGGRTYHSRGPLTWATADDGSTVVLLGRPVDIDHDTADALVIADRLARLAVGPTEDSTTAGQDPLVRAAAGLGGRWTLFAHAADGGLTVLTDALASQQVWHTDDGAVVGSHETLVAGATLLPANSLLRVDPAGATTVRRYFPWTQPEPTPSAGVPVLERVRDRLAAHTRLLTGQGRPAVALTAGPASRAVLAAYLAHPREGGFAFTHFATESAREGPEQALDMFAASRLAHRVGLPHLVVRAVAPPEESVFAVAHRLSFPRGSTVASAFARAALPRDTVELHSAGAGVHDLASWESQAGDFRDGDLTHAVALPFNDRHLLELLLGLDDEQRDELAAELPD
ncbi:hypothetical protein MWU75_19480 [Ornithinimicrobium sp. F0845]|uniref:hypothetical protein n=1 Tax=Ornithinimicrobium sp. F0845 TaxID=2926412 RepID=UPI001FF171CC|nr:hypothetical protein [Ornithinimicrobium sp. F0845]MCK0114323.1 hypothetical protein [Ornithinimicrobium sp. F0845]